MMSNPTGRITQGQFSFLPDLSDAEITAQLRYGLSKGYAWSIEYTDDAHPRTPTGTCGACRCSTCKTRLG